MTAETDRLRNFAQRYTAAWCSQDAASVAAHFSPEGSLTINDGNAAVGRDAITASAQSFMTAFPDLKVFLDDLLVETERVFYHWTLTGTNTGLGGTGQKVRISGFEEWKIGEDGLIRQSRGRFDLADYRRQLQQGAGDGR
jgi:predicted ester cyclase